MAAWMLAHMSRSVAHHQNPRMIAEKIAHGSFQALKLKCRPGHQQRARESYALDSLLRQPVNSGPADTADHQLAVLSKHSPAASSPSNQHAMFSSDSTFTSIVCPPLR